MPVVLSDTTVLNNFAQIHRSLLLQNAFQEVAAPTDVLDELSAGERLGKVPRADWSWLKMVDLTEEERLHAAELGWTLGPGESACIAVAQARGLSLLTDDADARRLALSLGIKISGTLGVLGILVHQRSLSLEQADSLLAEMRERGYRSPVDSLRKSFGRAG